MIPRHRAAALITAIGIATSACSRSEAPPPPPATTASPADAPATERVVGPLSDADAAALATMHERLAQYLAIHAEVKATLPRLPDEATPEQIDKNQRAFEARIRARRRDARPGDVFTAEAQAVIRRLLQNVFSGPDGEALKSSVLDENPIGVTVTVNARYPDTVPLSTMPPQVLQTLPRLASNMEYRFVGNHLILLDADAHVVADFVDNAFPQ